MTQYSEQERLQRLLDYRVLDTAPEAAFDRLTQLAAQLFNVPMAVVSLVDAERQWFKSKIGIVDSETPRELAFCAHAIQQDPNSVMVVEDATRDTRFAENPLVTGAPDIRFYAGATLTTPEGHNLGTLCVIDTAPRPTPSEADLAQLRLLARIAVDELELRQAHRRAEEKQRQLEMAERMSAVGHWRLDVLSGKIEWSDELYRIHGVNRGSFDPQLGAALEFYAPKDRAHVEGCLTHAIATGAGYDFEIRLRRTDGALRDVMCKATCECDESGRVVAVVGVFQDITRRKRSEQAMATSEARYRMLADNARDLIMQSDLDGRVAYVSPSLTEITGFSADEVLGRPALEMIHPDDAPAVRNAVAAQFISGGAAAPSKVEYRGVRKDGREIWLEATPTLAFDSRTGRPCGVTDVIRDITARKSMEADLRQARIQAEAAAAVKAEFLANMSHELRTPLTSIIGFADLMAAQPELSATTRRFVDRVGDGSRALLAIVNDVLDFSKLEAGQVTIAPQRVVPAELARATLDLFTPQAGAKDLALNLACETPAGLAVMLDPDRVRQVLLNLVGNAVKFSAAGSVSLRLAYDADRERLRVEVADTGPGLTAEQQARLFQRFSQIDGELTRNRGGTGLGLAICKGLVEAMHGEIGVSSVPGEGSCFWFETPAPRAAELAQASPASAFATPACAGLRVLVADDHAANRELVRLFLSAVGAQVSEAEDGAHAMAAAAAEPFDLILMDLRMPRMDGREACTGIRAGYGPNNGTPILAFTADGDLESLDDLRDEGFDGLVSKPIQASALITAISEAARTYPLHPTTAQA